MKAAVIENNIVVNMIEVPAIDCYGDTMQLVEVLPELEALCNVGGSYVDGVFTPLAVLVDVPGDLRRKRNQLLKDSDWSQLADIPQTTKDAWAPYRQALRDLPEQPGFPEDVTWPTAPTA